MFVTVSVDEGDKAISRTTLWNQFCKNDPQSAVCIFLSNFLCQSNNSVLTCQLYRQLQGGQSV